jgi:hypothetical protein
LPIIGYSNGNVIAPIFYKKLYYNESPELIDEIRDNVEYYSDEEKFAQYKRLYRLRISEKDYHDLEVILGLVSEDGTPKRCWNCFSSRLRSCREQFEAIYLVEYDVECSDCESLVNTWSYGGWNL